MDQDDARISRLLFVEGTYIRSQVFRGDTATFVSELYQRWAEKFDTSQELERGAIFISYAREGKEAAKTLCDCLRKAGCDVWFDESKLVSGEVYSDTMRRVIQKECCVFISIISRYTEANEGFFHQERVWASDRSAYAGALGDFYLPVIVDPGMNPQELNREHTPRHFPVHIVTCTGGEAPDAFCQRVLELQKKFRERLTRE